MIGKSGPKKSRIFYASLRVSKMGWRDAARFARPRLFFSSLARLLFLGGAFRLRLDSASHAALFFSRLRLHHFSVNRSLIFVSSVSLLRISFWLCGFGLGASPPNGPPPRFCPSAAISHGERVFLQDSGSTSLARTLPPPEFFLFSFFFAAKFSRRV